MKEYFSKDEFEEFMSDRKPNMTKEEFECEFFKTYSIWQETNAFVRNVTGDSCCGCGVCICCCHRRQIKEIAMEAFYLFTVSGNNATNQKTIHSMLKPYVNMSI